MFRYHYTSLDLMPEKDNELSSFLFSGSLYVYFFFFLEYLLAKLLFVLFSVSSNKEATIVQ